MVGLIELIRCPRGSSTETPRTNASTPPLAIEAIEPVGMPSLERMPLISVKEPRSATKSTPRRTSSTWPTSLSRAAPLTSSYARSPIALNGTPPAAQATASTRPTCSYIAAIDAGSVMSTTRSVFPLREAVTTSCRVDSSALTAAPSVPVAPTKRTFTTTSVE